MSGGSFNYLYNKEPDDLFKSIWDIENMAEELTKMNYLDVAADMTRLAEYIKSARIRVGVLSEQLRPVMKAVEWYKSCDIGEDSLKKAIEEYRIGGTL